MDIKRRYKLSILIIILVIINIAIYYIDYQTTTKVDDEIELSNVTLNILNNIHEPIIITLYKSNNLKPHEERFTDNVLQIIETYQDAFEGDMHIEIINPYESLEVELEATNAGMKPVEIREKNNALRKIFIGLTIQVGNRSEILPQIVTLKVSTEYLISSSLRKLSENRVRRIAMLQGHSEETIDKISEVERLIRSNYVIDTISLSRMSSLDEYESVIIISPSTEFSDTDLYKLDEFLNIGKNIFIALDRVEYDTEENEGYKINTHLEDWLVHKGLLVLSDFIIDNSASNVRVEKFAPPVIFPYFPQITNFPSHITSEGIGVIALRFASSIEYVEKNGIAFTPLALTSDVSGKKSLPLRINMKHEWTKGDYLYPNLVVAALVEGALGPDTEKKSKIVVISDGDVALGNEPLRELDNHMFIANIIEWLSDNSGLVDIKLKGVDEEVNEKDIIINTWKKYFNVFFPLLVIGIVALLVFLRRKHHIDKLRTSNF